MTSEVSRLWETVSKETVPRPEHRPECMPSPTMRDTLFAQILHEMAQDKDKFERVISKNAALLRWAAMLPDERLEYIVWINRPKAA